MRSNSSVIIKKGRYYLVLGMFLIAVITLLGKTIHLQYSYGDILQKAGRDRQVRNVNVPAYRGMVTDRKGEPLAISVPAYAATVNPQQFDNSAELVKKIADVLAIDVKKIHSILEARKDKQFAYLKRQLSEYEAEQLENLSANGINLRREYRRFYPMGEATSHLIGVTNIDGVGIEGVERSLDAYLQGQHGTKKILRDRYGGVIHDFGTQTPPQHGREIALSIDRRIQYHAYRLLKSAIYQHRAESGSVLVMDARSGEILAIANQPFFNPHDRNKNNYVPNHRRNRALTDAFEPGSTIKPFIMAALLEHQHMLPSEKIQTDPGYYDLSGKTRKRVRDVKNFGELTLEEVIIKSSNVGIIKSAMRLTSSEMWQLMNRLGFGQIPGTDFPGETEGSLRNYFDWHDTDQAIMSYGYGLSVSAVQLAAAYAAIANNGWMPRPTLYKTNALDVQGEKIFKSETARTLRSVLERVVSVGTGKKAQIPGYTAAGKTGTTRKTKGSKYVNEYISIFSGFAPADNPAVVTVVVIDGATAGEYYGGRVAGPIFSEITRHALWLLNIPEDNIPDSYQPENLSYIMNDTN